MALIFPDSRGNQPSTHVLIIGVGGYRHLQGGVDVRQQVMQHVGLLHQLTSPPISAVAFAQHLLDSKDDLRASLGSIDLLISPSPDDPAPIPTHMQADPATMANIRAGYAAWRERCDRNEDNIAIFYFCGHGLEKTEQYLLAEDFGADPLNPWLGAFAFDSTRLAFNGCRADTQCFFIDACRKITSAMLQTRPNVTELEIVREDVPDCAFNLTMKAAARNETALGPRRGVSYFTQALLKALQGAVASQGSTGWSIETGQISAHITDILRLIKASEGFTQRCSCEVIGNTELLRINGTPKVFLNLACTPDGANNVVELAFGRPGLPPVDILSHQGAPWSLNVDAGFYVAEARFSQGDFVNAQRDIFALPPARDYLIVCNPT